MSPEARLKMSLAKRGRKLSTATKTKISQAHLGHPSYFPVGYTHTQLSNNRRSNTMKKVRAIRKTIYSQGISKRYQNPQERQKTAQATKKAMHSPEIREKHLKALRETSFLGPKTDKGQIEFLQKWNQLGFNFVPNYQVNNTTNLFYIDGYDPVKKVVIEFDSKYHQREQQKIKDMKRANIIISILQPNKFWRFDAVNKTFTQFIERRS